MSRLVLFVGALKVTLVNYVIKLVKVNVELESIALSMVTLLCACKSNYFLPLVATWT